MGFLSQMVKTSSIPVDLVKRLITNFEVPYFVETGTAGGDSLRVMARLFQKCYSIEIVNERYETLKQSEWPDNVELYQGDSVEFVTQISSRLSSGYTLFWLDAHYSDNTPAAEGTIECPLLMEIEAISSRKAIILIDDARLFLGPPPWPNDPRQWPYIEKIFSTIKAKFPWHYTTIIDDYIISIPDEMKETLDQEWRDNYRYRYPSEQDRIRMHTKEVYEYFLKFIG